MCMLLNQELIYCLYFVKMYFDVFVFVLQFFVILYISSEYILDVSLMILIFIQEFLFEVEEKYKKVMVFNVQLDNEKNNLIYQVDIFKDVIEEQEEQMVEFYRENEEKLKVIVYFVLRFFFRLENLLFKKC